MDRKIVYPGQIPLSAQFLQSEKNAMIALAYIAEAVFGRQTIADGLLCTGMTPASLTVQVGPGHIWEVENIDGSQYGSIPIDNFHSIMKQGINLDAQPFTLTPPGIAGEAIDYLIQASLQEADADSIVLPYVNSQNPSQPWTGPENSGVAQMTTRRCTVLLSAKAGTAATAGTQVPPAPDAGFVGLYKVTVAFGATTLDGSNIAQLDDAPFLFKKLPHLPRWVQSGEFLWGDDTGTANAIVTSLTPLPLEYKKGMHVFVKKMNAANSGNVTINANGLGAVAVLDITGAQIGVGNMTANMVLHLCYDGAAFRWINGSVTNTSISSITATSGEGITVGGEDPFPVSLNFPGLSAGSPTALDLLAFYDNEGAAHKKITYANFLALILAAVSAPSLATVAPVMMVEHRRTGSAPTATNLAWTKHPLNTEVINQIGGASLAGDQLSLPAGNYRAAFAGVAWKAGVHTVRLRNVTAGVTLGRGLDGDSNPSVDAIQTTSAGIARFTLGATSALELQHYIRNESGSNGKLGDDDTVPDYHLDAWVEIVKEA